MEEEVFKLIPCLVLFCLRYSDTHFYFKEELSKLSYSPVFESISDSVMHFYIAYAPEFDRIIESVFEDPRFMTSKWKFFVKIGIRCLKMCEDPTFFNFSLMCAFVGRVTDFCYKNGKCYRVAETACKCAIAVSKRKLLELFNQEGVPPFYNLLVYSNCVNEIVSNLQEESEDLKDTLTLDPGSKQHVLRLLDACIDLDSTEYNLTDFEKKLLYKVPQNMFNKQNPGLDFLMHRIPRKYFQIHRNQDCKNTMPNVNLRDTESSQRVECSMQGNHSLLSPCSTSSIIESYALPIDYSLKKDSESSNHYIIENPSEPSNCYIIEKQYEPTNCCTIEKQSAPSNCSVIEKQSVQSNCSIIEEQSEQSNCSVNEEQSEQSNCSVIEKQSEPSNCCTIEKQSEPSNCSIIDKQSEQSNCMMEKEGEPLNCCIRKRDSKLSNKEPFPEGCKSSVSHIINRKEMQYASFEAEAVNKGPELETETSRMLKRNYSFKPMNSELLKLEYGKRGVESLQIVASPERDTQSISKRRKMCNSSPGKLLLATDCGSSENQYVPSSGNCLSVSTSSYEDRLPNSERSPEKGVVSSKKPVDYSGMLSDEDENTRKYPSTSFTNWNYLQLENRMEEELSLASNGSLLKTPDNIFHCAQEQSLSRLHQGKSPLKITHSIHCDKKSSSICSLSSECSSSGIQPSSERYFTSETPDNISQWAQKQSLSRLHQGKTPLKTTHSNHCDKKSSSICSLSSESSSSGIQPSSERYFTSETPDNISQWAQEQSSSRLHQGQPPITTTHSKVAPANYSSNHCDRKYNSTCSLNIESSSSSSQSSSEDYLTSQSVIADARVEEFQNKLSSFYATCSPESSLSDQSAYQADWLGDITLESLMNYKCLHCGTKCFNYIIYVFQQFTGHSIY